MKWYENAIFYHIYPLGLCGCPKQNDGVTSENHFDELNAWSKHVKKLAVMLFILVHYLNQSAMVMKLPTIKWLTAVWEQMMIFANL